MTPVLEIFSQGEEITRGQITDTNATWLSQQAVDIGFTVTRHTAVGDKLEDLVTLLKEIAQRADCCLCTGGLGPTSDDLTAEAVSIAFGLPLEFDAIAYGQMAHYFASRNRPMPKSNDKQAFLPQGAERLDNNLGTAPGFAVKHQRCWFAFMPGVPSEMRQMYLDKIQPTLPDRFSLQPGQLLSLRTLGLGESAIQERLADLVLPNGVQIGYRAAEDVQVKLLFPYAYPQPAMHTLATDIANRLGNYVFAIEGLGEKNTDLPTTVDRLMQKNGHSLAAIETISQGLLAAKCIGTNWLLHASFENSLERLKARFAITEGQHDWHSMAKDIAQQLQQQQGVDFALVQLCTNAPLGGDDTNKPLSMMTLLLAGDTEHYAEHSLGGNRQRQQLQAALLSLDVIRRSFGMGRDGFA